MRQETERFGQDISPLGSIGRLHCMHNSPQSRRSRKGKLHALLGDLAKFGNYFCGSAIVRTRTESIAL
jgi:hypothetical protein